MQAVNFGLASRYEQLDKLGDPLPKLSALVDWEGFRSLLSRIREKERKSLAGRKPYKDNPAKLRQKDVDARWTKKNGENYYGYKNHIGIDTQYKLIRHFEVTSASVDDSQMLSYLIDEENTSKDVWADSAYRSRGTEAWLKEAGYRSHIHTKGRAGKPLSDTQQRANKKRSKVRVRVEHVFATHKPMVGDIVRTIGYARARVKLGMINMAYNIKRWNTLEQALA